ncbi:hypothetical protein [Nocardiopsis halotolerans]|uniref:hypothetical protein n=1 Tax=Nocardiopsis halotolerans TaxID=124252 RepID=UPI00034DFCA2|nr:hypothetical protein [Nocardiopsis halotolerans]
MSTSREDTNPTPTDAAPEEAENVPAAEGTETFGETEASGAFISGAPVRSPGGPFSAEAFSVISLMLFALTAVNTRLFELFGFFAVAGASTNNPGEMNTMAAEVMVAGGLSALTVLAGAVSLFRSNVGTRAWSRWAATAAVVVGALLVAASALTYVSL